MTYKIFLFQIMFCAMIIQTCYISNVSELNDS